MSMFFSALKSHFIDVIKLRFLEAESLFWMYWWPRVDEGSNRVREGGITTEVEVRQWKREKYGSDKNMSLIKVMLLLILNMGDGAMSQGI